jgi:Rhodanese-like domain
MRRWKSIWVPALAATCALFAFAHAARADKAKDGFGELTVDQVQALLDKKDASVFDNNSKERWQQSHLPGAKWVAFNGVKAQDLPQEKDRKLVFYCANEH